MCSLKKDKIINDPIYGFVQIEKGIIFDLIEHPFFQRLRRISQLGLSYLVYPGAYHTRFHHAIGCVFLMKKAIDQIRKKGHKITKKEAEAICIAILLHDIGHGPFSHTLEKSIVNNINHEMLSLLFMEELNKQFNGKLSLAIQIFNNGYKKKFLHQLVSSQLDMDRLDYLKRDSFYSGVQEGVIGTERIINMLNVVDDNLVIEEKGIYSIEKFLIARRLMYWQVYLHKTVLSAENTLIKILKRAKELILEGKEIFATSTLLFFLKNNFSKKDFQQNSKLLHQFAMLDDYDIYASIKQWISHDDFVLSSLSKIIIDRKLLKVKIQDKSFSKKEIQDTKKQVKKQFSINDKEVDFFVFSDKVSNSTYNYEKAKINILMKDGSIKELKDASDQLLNEMISKKVNKFFLCYPNLKQ
ncbi:MAG: HD domain-containing protein [Flavobacteriales bacterium]|nr:HD domain-containing protein [Flavobacteriales bacterium]